MVGGPRVGGKGWWGFRGGWVGGGPGGGWGRGPGVGV